MDSQELIILKHLQEHEKITSMEAFQLYGITRLSARIYNLRKNYNIASIRTESLNRYGRMVNFVTYKYNGELKHE